MGQEIIDGDITDVWVFGYGSILWNPGFQYTSRCVGYVDGFARRFWQGSVTHRGTQDSPGRVATLIQINGNKAWGMAYHLVGVDMVRKCLEHLGIRECHLGGYELHSVNFIEAGTMNNIKAWAFIAVPGNRLYLGPASLDDQAVQVVQCRGVNGCNAEYITKLATFIRHHIPQDNDTELFLLDAKIRSLLDTNGMTLKHKGDVDGCRSATLTLLPTTQQTSGVIEHNCDSVMTDLMRKRDNSISHVLDIVNNSMPISVRAC
jgi:cation transport protein ChaC